MLFNQKGSESVIWGSKRRESDANKRLEVKLLCEQGDLRLNDGRLIRPLDEALDRWTSTGQGYSSMPGICCDVLYQMPNERWLLVHCVECKQSRSGGSTIFHHAPNPVARFIDPLAAVDFLLYRNFELPDGLRETYNNWIEEQHRPKPPVIRPLHHWVEKHRIDAVGNCPAHQVDFRSYFKSLSDHLLELAKQFLKPDVDIMLIDGLVAYACYHFLNLHFKVDPDDWDWKKNGSPPEVVDVIRLEWPDTIESTIESIIRLREITEEPLLCLAASNTPPGWSDKPNEEEKKHAILTLQEYGDELRDLITSVNVELREWIKNNPTEAIEEDIATENADTSPQRELVRTNEEAINLSATTEELPNMYPGERNEHGIPILRLDVDGFHFDGRFTRLVGKPLAVLRMLARNPERGVLRVNIAKQVWDDAKGCSDNAIDQNVSKIRKAIRTCLHPTDKCDPIPRFGNGKTLIWKLAFQFELIDVNDFSMN